MSVFVTFLRIVLCLSVERFFFVFFVRLSVLFTDVLCVCVVFECCFCCGFLCVFLSLFCAAFLSNVFLRMFRCFVRFCYLCFICGVSG